MLSSSPHRASSYGSGYHRQYNFWTGRFFLWLASRFLRMVLAVIGVVLLVIYILHFADNAGGKRDFVGTLVASSFETLDLFFNFLPFIFIIATVLFFANLQEKTELIAIKVSTFSPLHIIAPPLIMALLFGIFYIFAFSPLINFSHDKWVNRNNNDQPATLTITGKEFWLRENIPEGAFEQVADPQLRNLTGAMVIHGFPVKQNENQLKDPQFFFIGMDGILKIVWLAEEAILNNNQWQVKGVKRYQAGVPIDEVGLIMLPSQLTKQTIKDLLIAPKRLSIYQLYNYLTQVRKLGFSTYSYEVYFYQLWILPLIFMTMTLLAAGFGLEQQGRGQKMRVFLIAIILGFFIHFFFELLRGFIISQNLPAILTTLIPTTIMLLFAMTLFLHREEH